MPVAPQPEYSQNARSDSLQDNGPLLTLVGVCVVLLGVLLSQFTPPVLVFAVLALTASVIVIPNHWPQGALIVLIIASVMPQIKVEIAGWNARPEHYAALLVLGAFAARVLLRGVPKISLTTTDYWVVAYVLWNYVSSALMSPDTKLTLRWALLTNFAVLPYFLIQVFIINHRILSWTLRAFLTVGVIECAYAVICFTSWQLFGTSFGVAVGQYSESGLGGAYGTQYEPNILGSYSACLAVMLLVLLFLTTRRATWIVGATITAVASLLVSLSRAAVLSFALTSFILLLFGIHRGVVKIRKLLPITLGLAIFLAPIAATSGKNLLARFENLSGNDVQNDIETMGRLVSWTVALQDIWQHPIVGNGTASFQLLAGARLGDSAWIANSAIRIVHDTGVIGLLLFSGIIFSLGRRIKRVIAGSGDDRDLSVALSAGCLVYGIAFMSADGTMLSFFWVHLGLLSSACSFANKRALEL